jgi:hypothetical protein
MRSSAFSDSLRRFQLENLWLKEHFLTAAARSPKDERALLSAEMAVIRLHDAWSRYCKELVIISALGRIHTLGGKYLNPCIAARSRKQALLSAVTAPSGKLRWIKWGDAGECIKVCARFGISNLNTVAAALGANNTASEEIRCVRNFFAHRGRGTYEMAMKTGRFPASVRPDVWELAIGGLPAGTTGLTTIEVWIGNLEATAEAAAQ